VSGLFRDIILSKKGQPAFVLGGGFSGRDQFSSIRLKFPNAVLISANSHGEFITRCDYIVVVDDLKFEFDQLNIKTPTISFHPWADHRLIEYPSFTNTGQYAVWVAWCLGCYPILAFGMDCFTGKTYHHDPEAYSTGKNIPFETHLQTWRVLRKRLSSEAIVRMVGGPVPPIFPSYDPSEEYSVPEFPDRFEAIKSHLGKRVRIVRRSRIGSEGFEVGQVVELSERDARHLVERRRAISAPISL
jgi:hypothetical protein